jgi:guanylate kinase
MKRPRRRKSRARQKPRARRRGLMFVLSSPSGAGKTTLTHLLLEEDKNVRLSVSVTTRARRQSEVHGKHYDFISRARFVTLHDAGKLLEWAQVHGNFYGTPKADIERLLRAGKDVLFDIDWQGTLQLYAKARPDVVSIFILPPSAAELRKRLARRAEDDHATIGKRLANARDELDHWKEYDYVLVNRDLDRCFASLRAILAAERARRAGLKTARARQQIASARRLRRERQKGLAAFVRRLQRGL